jgi:hypothetical protein
MAIKVHFMIGLLSWHAQQVALIIADRFPA